MTLWVTPVVALAQSFRGIVRRANGMWVSQSGCGGSGGVCGGVVLGDLRGHVAVGGVRG